MIPESLLILNHVVKLWQTARDFNLKLHHQSHNHHLLQRATTQNRLCQNVCNMFSPLMIVFCRPPHSGLSASHFVTYKVSVLGPWFYHQVGLQKLQESADQGHINIVKEQNECIVTSTLLPNHPLLKICRLYWRNLHSIFAGGWLWTVTEVFW